MVDSRTVELTANDNTPDTWFWLDLQSRRSNFLIFPERFVPRTMKSVARMRATFFQPEIVACPNGRGGKQMRSLFGSGRARRRRPQLRSRRNETAKSVFIDEVISS
jgi:hypothetical protein